MKNQNMNYGFHKPNHLSFFRMTDSTIINLTLPLKSYFFIINETCLVYASSSNAISKGMLLHQLCTNSNY